MERPGWAKTQRWEGTRCKGPQPSLHSTCFLTYHYGSSCLGPKGLQHLPLHKEVGEKDERGYFCDGGNSKGPLWKEMQTIGLPLPCPELRGSSWEIRFPLMPISKCPGRTLGQG